MSKKHRYFGTDGIRGKVGEFPITADFILKLGWAVGKVLTTRYGHSKVLIGKDTRISGYMFESALQAGLSAAGTDIYLSGPMPTSAIAYLTRTLRAHIGIVISASHNPYDDNGIKFFSQDGYKISDDLEAEIEQALDLQMETGHARNLGKAWRVEDAAGRYIEFCKSSIPHHSRFDHLKIILDCANGAAYHTAPHVFSELGARVINLHNTPNGFNINKNNGSNHPDVLAHHVLAEKADVGIAFDGDGDRVVMVDHRGNILDGDDLLFIIVQHFKEMQNFKGGLVGTEMTNRGLEAALAKDNIPFVRVPVGDQNVIQALIDNQWELGGESSGHIIYLPVTTTADGVITALQVLQSVYASEKSLYELCQGFNKFPQRLINVPHYGSRIPLNEGEIKKHVKQAENILGQYGRILLRYSGTEPVIRIMAEGEDLHIIDQVLTQLATMIEETLLKLGAIAAPNEPDPSLKRNE